MLAGPQGSLKKTCPHRCHQHPGSLTPSPALCPSRGFPEQSPATFPVGRCATSRGVCEENHAPLLTAREEPSPLPPTPPPWGRSGPGLPLHSGAGGRTAAAAAATAAISGLHPPARAGREMRVGALRPSHRALTSQGDAVPVSPGPPRRGGARRLSSQRGPAAGSTLEPRSSRFAQGAEQRLPQPRASRPPGAAPSGRGRRRWAGSWQGKFPTAGRLAVPAFGDFAGGEGGRAAAAALDLLFVLPCLSLPSSF